MISGETLTIGRLSRDPRLLLMGDGEAEDYRAMMLRNGLGAQYIVLDAGASEDFQIGRVPSAALIDASGDMRARGTVQRREQLEACWQR